VVKSEKRGDLHNDLKETFKNLCKFKMMLNPKKCVFGVSPGKLLNYMVSSWGIDVNPKKVEVIKKLQPPQIRKEIQKLAGMMAVLSQFISKLGECGVPSYKLLRKADGSSGMIKQQRRSFNSSNILGPCQPWYHPSLMTCCYYMWQPPMLWLA
jgi:hypothetical protein